MTSMHDQPLNIPLVIKFISRQQTSNLIALPENLTTDTMAHLKCSRKLESQPISSNFLILGLPSTLFSMNPTFPHTNLCNIAINKNLLPHHLLMSKENTNTM
jgi:hypothetical protein